MPRAYPHSHIVEGKLVGFSVAKLYGDSASRRLGVGVTNSTVNFSTFVVGK